MYKKVEDQTIALPYKLVLLMYIILNSIYMWEYYVPLKNKVAGDHSMTKKRIRLLGSSRLQNRTQQYESKFVKKGGEEAEEVHARKGKV